MSHPNSAFFQTFTHQYGTSDDAPLRSATPAQSQYGVPQFYALTDHPSSGSGHDSSTDQHCTPTFVPSQSATAEQSQRQNQHLYVPTDYLTFDSGYETPVYQHNMPAFFPSQFATPMPSQYDLNTFANLLSESFTVGHEWNTLAFAPSQEQSQYLHNTAAYQQSRPIFIPAQPTTSMQPEYQVHQLDAPTEHLSFDSEDETPAGSVDYALLQSVAPPLSQDQVDIQPDEPVLPIPSECPICGTQFGRVQERNRHIESYLPHSIHCPSQSCPWTGRRLSGLKIHWKNKHSWTGQVPGKEKYEIYDPKEFVKSIINGNSHVEVAQYAFRKVQERFKELGKVDIGANVFGRKLDIEISCVVD